MVGSGSRRVVEGYWMKLPLVGIAVALAFAGSGADAKLPPLRDPVFLNIGFVCQWQESCIEKQQRAMKRSLGFVKKNKPPAWKVQFCNRRASFRRTGRIDWISYYNCISNRSLGQASAGGRRTAR
jgi:hypothetical protein